MQASFRIARAIGKTKTGLAFAESGDVSAEKFCMLRSDRSVDFAATRNDEELPPRRG